MTSDQLEAALAAAYLRGIDWVQDNGYSEYRHKAAADYADKTVAALSDGAAAPDLLEACQEALRFISDIDNSHKSVRQLRAAIAKAQAAA
jgi:hypothetical protein